MTAAFVQTVVSGSSLKTGNNLALTVNAGVTTTVGNVVIVWARAGSGFFAISAVDSRGNTWQVDNAGGTTAATCGVLSAIITTPLVAGDTITITFSGSPITGFAAGAGEFSGLDTSLGHPNVVTSNTAQFAATSGSIATPSSGTAGAAGDLVLSATGNNGASGTGSITTSDSTSGGTWTQLNAPTQGQSTTYANAAYEIATGVAQYTSAWSWTGSPNSMQVTTVIYALSVSQAPQRVNVSFPPSFYAKSHHAQGMRRRWKPRQPAITPPPPPLTVTATTPGGIAGTSLKVVVLTGATEAGGAQNSAEVTTGVLTWTLTPAG